ncbi:MAG: cobalamin ABC transporter substrate-binding protein [Polyangiaceae bacterium]|nr:cobalamin ABC transporter substrate-binding protein [Polyangiaceae bacterium]
MPIGFTRRRAALRVASALLLGVLSAASGCGPSGSEAQSPSALGLRPWDEHARTIFDDNIEPAAVGYTMEVPPARGDKYLRERALTAQLVARFRVQTVTVDTIGDDSRYHLGVQVATPTLVPNPKIEEKQLELLIKPASAAYGIAKAMDQRMQGLTFIGFVHRFASADGTEVEYHWHFSPDNADVAEAVKEAVFLAEASGK